MNAIYGPQPPLDPPEPEPTLLEQLPAWDAVTELVKTDGGHDTLADLLEAALERDDEALERVCGRIERYIEHTLKDRKAAAQWEARQS